MHDNDISLSTSERCDETAQNLRQLWGRNRPTHHLFKPSDGAANKMKVENWESWKITEVQMS